MLQLVDEALVLTEQHDRADLRRRLRGTRGRILDPTTRVIVVGEFKQGKSKLINALVTAPVCPVDDDAATTVPTVVRHGAVPSALVIVPRGHGDDPDSDIEVERRPIEMADIAQYVSEAGNSGNHQRLLAAEISLPRTILTGGLVLVDSPGVGGLDGVHALATMTALASADVMIFVSDASQEYTEPEMQFLRQAMRVCPTVATVLTKTDLYPQWRRIAEINRGHLDAVDAAIPSFSVSSDLRLRAQETMDGELNDESGFPPLVSWLRQDVVGKAQRLRRRSVGHDVQAAASNLALVLDVELATLTDPDGTPRMIAEVESAKNRADELRRRSARWQVTLTDGMADLIADLDHDLRDRIKHVQAEAEKAIDAADPGPAWDDLVDWLEGRVASAVSDTFIWTSERATFLSQEVADHFAEGSVALPMFAIDETEELMEPVGLVPDLDSGHLGPIEKVLLGMRGSYGGVLMVGLVTGILGMALINPFSIAAGLLIGTKVYRDEQKARLKKRQAEAKVLIRRQMDDVVFQVAKQLRDRIRAVQRGTRDHFSEIAEAQHRSLQESLLVAQTSGSIASGERDARVKQLRTDLKRIGKLADGATSLMQS